MPTFKDQLNREIYLKEVPKRIISLVPSQTELLVDLGLEASIVGITKFCVYPKHLKKSKTVVGGTKQVKVEKIRGLQPDIILCNKEENSEAIINSLKDIAPIHISDIYNLEDSYALIKIYGQIFQVVQNAEQIVVSIEAQRKAYHRKKSLSSKFKVAYFIWKEPWMVAGSNTFIDTMITEAGFVNVFKGIERYPEITLDDDRLLATEIILLSSEPFPFKEKHVSMLKNTFPDKEILIVDGEMFSWYGSRMVLAFKYFTRLLK